MINETSEFAKQYLQKRGYSETRKKEEEIQKEEAFNVNWKHKSILQLLEEDAETDPIEIIRKRSREIVLKAYTMGWQGPPFNVEQLALLLGYQVSPNEIITEARIIPSNDSFIIEYNPFQSPARINFSIAHEIAHTLFSDCSETIRYRNNHLEKGSWELEFLCNIGASELLLPYAEFTNAVSNIEPKIDNIISIARNYNASVESVFLRFCDVIDYPCSMAICSFNNEGDLIVNYSKNSKSSNLRIQKGSVIPRNSKVYECNKPRWTAYESEQWDNFNEPHNIEAVGISPIRKQLNSRVAILITPKEVIESHTHGIYLVTGDATEPRGNSRKIIVQVVNDRAGVGFGFGKSLSKKYKDVRTSLQNWKKDKSRFILGSTNLVRVDLDISVFQILAQVGLYPKNNQIPLKYSSLREGLIDLREFILENPDYTVHMPAIGSGQAGGNWNIIKGMIYDELVLHDIEVTIYFLPSKNLLNKKQTLILSDLNEE